MPDRCDAYHDGHDCRVPGACRRALLALCARVSGRRHDPRLERERAN